MLLVPDNKYLSQEFAKTIRDFVSKGGCAYVEGKSCEANPITKELCRDGEKVATLAGSPLFKRTHGKGVVLYTKGFVSAALPLSLPAKRELKSLLKKYAGPPPVCWGGVFYQ